MHVGQPEYTAGKAAGEKAKAAGIKSFLCVNHYATNPASFERCRGFADAIGVDFKSSTLDAGQDPTGVQSKVSAYLRNHPNTQAVLTLGPLSAAPTIKALQQMGLAGKIWFATFDFANDIAKGIQDGTIQFAIDQQPYLQGYIPVAVLAIVKKDHTTDPAKIRQILEANPKFKHASPPTAWHPPMGRAISVPARASSPRTTSTRSSSTPGSIANAFRWKCGYGRTVPAGMKKVDAAGRNRSGRPTPAFITFYVHHAPCGQIAVRTATAIARAHQGELQWA